MKKSMTFILIVIFMLLLSGCWSKRELNELALVAALGIDKINDEYIISVQVINPGEISSHQSSSGRSPVITYVGKGESLFDAIRKITTLSPRILYFSHLQLVVFGEELARDGFGDAFDFLVRDQEIRNDFNILVAKESTAKGILNVLTPIEKIPANKILNSARVSEKSCGSTLFIDSDELINLLGSENNGPVLSSIEVIGDKVLGIDKTNVERIETPAILKFTGLAVFKKDKLVGYLSEKESKHYNFLNDKIESTIEIISCPKEGTLSTEITQSKTKINGKFDNGVPKIKVKIDIQQNVAEVKCDIDLSEENNLKIIDKKTSELVKENVEQTINTIQNNYQVDILGFGEVLHREDYKAWNAIKEEWSTLFRELEVDVEVNVNTFGTATMLNTVIKNEK